jgi:hypothetical protein
MRGVGAVLGVLLAVSGCGAADADPIALPTFPASSSTATSDGPAANEGAIPDDCERLLKVADLNALLGLPLDTVTVRSTLGVPEPSVGRTERVACRYTTKAAGPARGRPLLDLNAAAYTTPDAALAQWRRNADVEDGVHRELPIGSAGAVLVERSGEALLSVVYGPSTVTLMLPDQPLPGGRPRAEALVDLALRVLPAVAPPARPNSGAPVGTAAGSAAGTPPATSGAAPPAGPRAVGSP